MADTSAAPAAAPDAAPDAAEKSTRQMEHPFDAKTTQCIPDLRALCRLPADADEDGVQTFRALLLPIGQTLHVPGEPGCYATVGPYRTQTALNLVHFVESTKREDELLLTFVDYGMVNAIMTGVYVQTLQLPLQKQRNVYEETPRYTSVKDIAGFSKINPKAQPWCALLKPALERQPVFAQLGLFTALECFQSLKVSLSSRLRTLHEFAVEDIAKLVADLERQDPRAAQKQKAKYEARLAATMSFFESIGPKKYDRTIKDRVLVVDVSQPSTEAQWLQTPDRLRLSNRTAILECTGRRGERQQPAEPTAEPTPIPAAQEPAAETAEGEFPELSDDADVVPESELEAPAPAPGQASSQRPKRARATPARLDQQPVTKKGKKGKVNFPNHMPYWHHKHTLTKCTEQKNASVYVRHRRPPPRPPPRPASTPARRSRTSVAEPTTQARRTRQLQQSPRHPERHQRWLKLLKQRRQRASSPARRVRRSNG